MEIERYPTLLDRLEQARDLGIATLVGAIGTRVMQLMIQWYYRKMSKMEILLKEHPINMLRCGERNTEMAEVKRNLQMGCLITCIA